MKMESNIPATATGTITRILVNIGDKVEGDDLIMEISDE
jgi:biotin carboxyl carrier protein